MGVDLAAKKEAASPKKSMRLHATLFCSNQDAKGCFPIRFVNRQSSLSSEEQTFVSSTPLGVPPKIFKKICHYTYVHNAYLSGGPFENALLCT